jgi:CRP/FNR family transcriptional regulator, nitrogen oxide reductase regulator
MTGMLDSWSAPHQQGEPFYGRSNWTDRPTTVHLKPEDHRAGTVAARPPLFAGILPEDYTRIAGAARVKEFARGDMLYIGGDSVSQVLLLTSGFAKISQFGLSGMEVILRLSVPGDVLGAMGLFTTGLHFTTAQAFRNCRALVWDAPTFRALVTRYPVLHQNMVKILSEDLLELQERFREVATERVAPRVARQLVRVLSRIGRSVNGAVEVSLTREELAQMTGTTLFSVSRLLSAWEERGLVKPRREGVTICDVPSLRMVAEEG